MATPEVWKKSEILNQLGGDEVFLRELMGDLAVLIQDSRRDLQSAFESEDLSKAASLSHTLKGSSGNLSAHEIFHICKSLELACRARSPDIPRLHKELNEALDRFLEVVRGQGFLD